jgi:hypothetical protein
VPMLTLGVDAARGEHVTFPADPEAAEPVIHAQRSSNATVSTCGVCGNMSTGFARSSR